MKLDLKKKKTKITQEKPRLLSETLQTCQLDLQTTRLLCSSPSTLSPFQDPKSQMQLAS